MTKFLQEIWCEGDPRRDYTACHLGYGKGETLKEACNDLASRSEHFRNSYNAFALKYKNCKLFNNEADARLSHG
jgi:hypothetical protein